MKRFFLCSIVALYCLPCIASPRPTLSRTNSKKPRVSIITSVFKGDQFIQSFLEDIVKQSIFKDCELILINANSPGNEEPVIKEYAACYPKIIYTRLDKDPGLYAVWNMGIKMASADFITNANIDDKRHPSSIEIEAQALEQDTGIDLVYGDFLISYRANAPFENNGSLIVAYIPDFSAKNMRWCLPGPQPMWRKSMHKKYGFFSNDFSSSGDHEMWLRAVSKGSIFKKIPGFISGMYYENPMGLSTDREQEKARERDEANSRIVQLYSYIWQ